jgi:hypothetical protein
MISMMIGLSWTFCALRAVVDEGLVFSCFFFPDSRAHAAAANKPAIKMCNGQLRPQQDW